MGRKLGQHFLSDPAAQQRIARAITRDASGAPIVEIGPGRGALTQHLIGSGARVIAIEIDPALAAGLRERFAGSLEVIEADVLDVDLAQWGPVTVAGNLPYYITSPIVDRVLKLGRALRTAVFLVQEEVANRLAAGPGSRDYGFLSVRTQIAATAEKLFRVPASAFRPPPKVHSAVVRLTPHAKELFADTEGLVEFAALAFQHKRKTLRNNLAAAYDRALLDAQPEASLRAEQLSVTQLADLYRRLAG